MKKGFKLRNSPPAPDGTWESEVIYEDDMEADAGRLHSDCNGIAEDLQSDCNDIAETSQSDCKAVAECQQGDCKPPQRPLKKPIAPLNMALVDYLSCDKKFRKLVYGNFESVENLAQTQKTAPSYLTESLQDLGFKDITNDDVTRYYLPAARVQRERRKTNIWKKTSITLGSLLVITILAMPSRTETSMSRVEVSQTGDSALYWSDMVKFITAYNAESVDKIYPFSYPIVYNRINENGIKDVKGIKQVFDNRIAEIKDSKKN